MKAAFIRGVLSRKQAFAVMGVQLCIHKNSEQRRNQPSLQQAIAFAAIRVRIPGTQVEQNAGGNRRPERFNATVMGKVDQCRTLWNEMQAVCRCAN